MRRRRCRGPSLSNPHKYFEGLSIALDNQTLAILEDLDLRSRERRAMIKLTIVFALLPILLWQGAYAEEIVGRASVTDGDTLIIQGERIRLHGIDAPERAQTCEAGGKAWRCGQKASLALADKIGRLPVRCETFQRDRYGRAIAICRQGQTDLNRWMVRNGWALAYRRYSADYITAEKEARQDGLGLWQGRFVPPWDWRRGERIAATLPANPGVM